MRIALGTVESEAADNLLAHAAACDACGDELSRCLDALGGHPSSEEAAAIAELANAKSDWRSNLARELASTSARKAPRLTPILSPTLVQAGLRTSIASALHINSQTASRWRRVGLAAAGVAAALLAAATLFLWQRQAHDPEHQLAVAYSQSRTLELRIPEAKFAGIAAGKHTRGASGDEESSPLLEARAGLARKLEQSPQDTHWLQLQARADVLEERYDSATEVLDRLLATAPVTPELLTDAASAYYQRGTVSGSELDRSTALDYLRRADEMAPTDPVVLFNEAIVMEDRGQMMNAVEVWNRYIIVERDPQWVAEGRRKLAALEQTLNRLKTHTSRVNQMLSSPQAMDDLAADPHKLAAFDEELSYNEIDRLMRLAFPLAEDTAATSEVSLPTQPQSLTQTQPRHRAQARTQTQARGSPCVGLCPAARRLLQATAHSLETQHHDSWLTDLLSPDIDSLPPATAGTFALALRRMGQAVEANMAGFPNEGGQIANQSLALFDKLRASGVANPSLLASARSGRLRTEVEYLFSLQRQVNFEGCRAFARGMEAVHAGKQSDPRYPWMAAQWLVTEKVCDDDPATRIARQELGRKALQIAENSRYGMLKARIRSMEAAEAADADDGETAERLTLNLVHDEYKADYGPRRVAYSYGSLSQVEEASPRAYMAELSCREEVSLFKLFDIPVQLAQARMELVRAELRIGSMQKARSELTLANQEWERQNRFGKSINFSETEIFMANFLLERGDLKGAEQYLDKAARQMDHYSDAWGLRSYAAARGQLELAHGQLDRAAKILQSEIRSSEEKYPGKTDIASIAEFAEQDKDLYAELAATWLAQGRSPGSILALWERFRLRSRGLPITPCRNSSLDCEEPRLLAQQERIGNDVLIGQIVLLDRVLIYRMDRNGISWSQKPLRRQSLTEAALTLEHALSTPYTSEQTAERLGARLSDTLLPALPASAGPEGAGPASLGFAGQILLEPDPAVHNLAWAVLPTKNGPLGLQYPLAELRSILADTTDFSPSARADTVLRNGTHTLVVGASIAAEGEPPLPEAMEEARSVSGFLRAAGTSPEVLLGKRANSANIGAALGTATVFHFAGHAAQSENGTELMLAGSSSRDASPWIDAAFLRSHPPRLCRLAVLSACATGRTEASWRRPQQNIVETLGALGVPEIVSTRWQIDSKTAVPFMDAFYASLQSGSSTAVALTSARRVLFRQSLYNNPYYWAAYSVTGREISQTSGELHARVKDRYEEPEQGKEKHFECKTLVRKTGYLVRRPTVLRTLGQ